MELPHAGDEELLGLGIEMVMQGGILFRHPVERGGDLVFVAPGLGLDGEGDGGLGEGDAGKCHGIRLVAEGVAGEGVLELGHHPDLPGA